MYLKNVLDKGGGIVKILLIASAAAALTLSSQSSKDGVKSGIELCLGVLIPSLFPFMALSALAVRTGACRKRIRVFDFLTRKLFGLSGEFAPVIILSLIGGYPVGARGIAELKQSGSVSENQAEKAALFAVCAGPGFLINYVGTALYGNTAVGLILLLAQVLSVIILGVVINLFDRDKEDYNSNSELYYRPIPFSSALVESTYSALKGMAQICGLVLLFSAATGVLESALGDSAVLNVWKIIAEVCAAVNVSAMKYPLEITAFAVGFGGLCVHFQVYAALGDIKINKVLFFFYRILQGLITAALTKLLSMVFLREAAVFSSGEVGTATVFGGSILSAAALTGVAVCFLFTLKNYNFRR